MNYFMSNIHGNSDAYFQIKQNINFKNNDELFILGDIFDGNNESPEECLKILTDIIESNNIHLLLGNHEYAHVMFYITKDNEETSSEWQKYLQSQTTNGSPLLHYMYSNLSEKERDMYMEYLIQCDLSDLVKIGNRYFYLTHGSPCVCKNGDVCEWQKDVATGITDLKYNYTMAINSDPGIKIPEKMTIENTYIISGHLPTRYTFEENQSLIKKYYPESGLLKKQQIIFENKRLLINAGNEGIPDNMENWIPRLACVAIDAAGFFVEYVDL